MCVPLVVTGIQLDCFFPTSLCGVLVLLAAIPPASVLPSLRPPRPLLHSSLAHSLTHHSLTHSLHTHTHSLTRSLTHSLITHSTHSLHSLTHSFTSLTHSLTPLTDSTHSPLGPSLSAVAGAVPRASRRACGARGRRWALRSLQWQAQYPEPPEGTAARVVAAGPPAVLCISAIVICKAMQCPETAEGPAARVVAAGPLALCSGRRSTQSLQKGLRRAWSPLGPLQFCALLPL